ncbi:GH32 C-terminal domain-containing protein [Corynebacterium sp. ES2794-CONJ1]|uniref:GH32 C-terminal domain-containing protein n=1 Tax=Corynebacterium sp. ES2794-CONJ1 TaxID=2980553 RepID=UPI0021D91ACE|nr:GH32 C-terminal domain-containing protein [Corynebacterium sp. ES2794-CONJ1]MCU9519263.1 GH32 C-terminal domain-containing protein [Corynebacterium sp. ES2794-CONJ1]
MYRPELHIHPDHGILDAPAGALYDGTYWHLFNQYRPDPTQPSRWAHLVSSATAFDFEICTDVLASTKDHESIRAGSVVTTGDSTTFYYTHVVGNERTIKAARVDDLGETIADLDDDDLILDEHIVDIGTVVANHEGLSRFRSPCVIPVDSGYLMVAVAGSSSDPVLVVLDSADGQHFKMRGPLTIHGDSGIASTFVVAPRIFQLRDEIDQHLYDILLVTIDENGRDIAGCLVGKLNGTSFEVAKPFQRMDYGHDFGRPRTVNWAPDADNKEHTVIFGLLNSASRQDDGSAHLSFRAEGWANCLSLAREITLQGGHIYQTPTSGIIAAIEESDRASMWTGISEIPRGEHQTITVLDINDQIICTITHYGDHITLDRSMNPNHAGDAVASAPLLYDATSSMTVIIDGSTVEVFGNGGQVAMASRVYFDGPTTRFVLHNSEQVEVERSTLIKPLPEIFPA